MLDIQVSVPTPAQVKYAQVGGVISNLVGLLMIAGSLAFFFMLLIAGVQWMLSGGDKAGIEGAKNKLTTALIGLLIVFSVWGIMLLVERFFGIYIITAPFDIPTILHPQSSSFTPLPGGRLDRPVPR